MRFIIAMAVVSVVGLGCDVGVRRCTASGECETGATCSEGFCVFADGGSIGGGSATGGGGATSTGGGGATGGGTGGGAATGGGTETGGGSATGGGATGECSAGCQAWESCQPGSGGTCKAVSVSIVSPANNTTVDGGASVQVTASVTDWDGGVWPGSTVPTSATAGVTTPGNLVKSGNVFIGDYTLPATATTSTIRVGWQGADASVTVLTSACSAATVASCAEWQECAPNTTGGTCVNAGLTLSWVSPMAGKSFNTATVPGQLLIQKSDGGVILPTSVPVRGPAGTVSFARTGTAASGSLSLSGIDEAKSYVAGWEDGGVIATLSITKDTMGPGLTVTVVDRPTDADSDTVVPKAWKKDEFALVKVVSDDTTVTVGTTNFTVPWGGAVTSVATGCGCAGAGCSCFKVDLAKSTVLGIRGTQNITVGPVSDAVGNPSNAPSGSISITRFKWKRALGSPTIAAPLPVAVSQAGLVVAGTVEAGANRVLAFAQTGTSPWVGAVSAGTVTAGPVLSTTDIWVGTLDSRARLQPIALATGLAGSYQCDQDNTSSYDGDLALATVALTAGTGERPVGVRGGELRVGDGSCGFNSLTAFTSPAHAVVHESTGTTLDVFVAGGGGTLYKALLNANRTWTDKGSAVFAVAPAKGLFLDGTFIGGGGVTNGGVFATSASADLSVGTTFATYAGAGAAQAGPVSVGAGYVLYGDTGGNLVKVPYSGGGFPPGVKTAIVSAGHSTQDTTPIIGVDGHIYSVAADGTLRVSLVSDLSKEWDVPAYFPITSGKIGQPALDVLRDGSGAKQCRGLGVLYVPTAASGAASLTAVLVDSQGLDPNAPWPKYQRDNANTGNISRSLDAWTCP